MIQKEKIMTYSASLSEYRAGLALYKKNLVTIERIDSFWRGEDTVSATVREKEDSRTVVVSFGEDQIRNWTCDCDQAQTKGNRVLFGMCRHCIATAFAYSTGNAVTADTHIRTSLAARQLLQQYTDRNWTDAMQLDGGIPVSLRPSFEFGQREASVQFQIGRQKFYILKDLTEFAHALEDHETVTYGKALTLTHTKEAFSEESQKLVDWIAREIPHQAPRGGWTQSRSMSMMRRLGLNRFNIEECLEPLVGTSVPVSFYREIEMEMPVIAGNPSLTLIITRKGKDGASLSLKERIWSMEGTKSRICCDGKTIYLCEEEYSYRTGMLLEQFQKQADGERSLDVSDGDLTVFCGEVLPLVAGYLDVEVQGLTLEDYEPDPLRTEFYFDQPEKDRITCELRQYYGNREYNPVTGDVPEGIYRDYAGEMRVRQIVTRYFPYRNEQGELVIDHDTDRIYQLLATGMKEFSACGEVFGTDAFHRTEIRHAPKVTASVRMDAGLLQLRIEAGELEKKELAGLLASYRQKKQYHRLADGSFLDLGDGSALAAVSELADSAGITAEQLETGEVHLERFWSAYLDQVLRKDGGISVYRDESFRKTIRDMRELSGNDFPVPQEVSEVLRAYQKGGYEWLRMLDGYGFGGILADEMGLGKSLQIITVLLADRNEKREEQAEHYERDTSLLVCPASLVYNWENEFRKFAPDLSIQLIVGNEKEREERLQEWKQYDVLITSYDLLRRDRIRYEGMNFRFQVIDEAQYIKNDQTQNAKAVKAIQAKTRYALTGTPVENHLGELWSIFDYLMPGFLGSSRKFREKFEQPIVKQSDQKAMERLHKMTAPFLLRRTKKEVLPELPEKLEEVVYAHMEGDQEKLYRASVLKLQEELEEAPELTGASRIQVLAQLTRLRQICCDPSLCFENYGGDSAKLSTCMELIHRSVDAGHKLLLFSQFTTMLDRIAAKLEEDGVSYHMLTGATPKEKRMAMVNQFQMDEVPVFLISLKAGGTGLNLTAADVVIHYDPWWNIAAQNQATDRAHRIGQDKIVTVFSLIAKGTIEEKIRHLQEMKQELAEQVLAGENGTLGSLRREELLELLADTP